MLVSNPNVVHYVSQTAANRTQVMPSFPHSFQSIIQTINNSLVFLTNSEM